MAVAPNDYVVVQHDAERGGGCFDVCGDGDIGLGRCGITRRVVMDQDQRRGAQVESAFDDLARIYGRMVYGAPLLALRLDQHNYSIEKQDVEFLDLMR